MKLFTQFVKNSTSLETSYVLYKNYLQSLQLKNPAKKISDTNHRLISCHLGAEQFLSG